MRRFVRRVSLAPFVLGLVLVASAACAACAATPRAVPQVGSPLGRDVEPSSRAAPLPLTWYRIDRLGRRIGWLSHEVVYEQHDGEEVLVERVEARTEMSREGQPVRFHGREERVYESGGAGRLLSAWTRRERTDGSREAFARCDPSGCDVVVQGDAPRVVRRLPPTRETSAQALAPQLAATQGRVEFAYLDLDELREETREARAAGEGSPPRSPGRAGLRIEIRAPGEVDPTLEWLAKDGAPLAARFSDGADLTVTSQGDAQLPPEKLELSSLAVIPLPAAVDRSRPIGEVRITLEELPEQARLPAAHRRYELLPDGAVRVVTVARRPPRIPFPLDTSEFARELAVTADIDHDHDSIRRLVARFPRDQVADALDLALVCAAVVGKALPKHEGAGAERASQILVGGKGGPDDAARLFVALARASGLPARVVTGFLYGEDDGVPMLVWSAWAEVFVGEWIEVDPFLGELPANPTHLPVGREGIGDAGFGLLGRLGVRAYEVAPGGEL